MARRPNGRRVKIHHNYTIRAAADVLGVHKHIVSRWIAAGLTTTDAVRPSLRRGPRTFERFCALASLSSRNVGRANSIA